jgi:hypothetical protein
VPVSVDLDEYRSEGDRFLSALQEEYYLQFSGQKDELALEPIYDRHADLTSAATCRELRELVEGGAGRSSVTELWRFACEGLLGRVNAVDEERVSALEATLQTEVAGRTIGYRDLRPAIANEPDRDVREELEQARIALTEELTPSYRDMLERTHEAAGELGGGTYRALYERFGFRLGQLAPQCEAFLAETEDLHASAFDRLLRSRLGIALADARRSDIPRLLRSDRWDPAFPAEGMLPALEGTLAELGIDLRAQRNVELDLEPRPGKDPRAFCSPIEVPGRVVLCIKPIGGLDDWRALFHEAGHMEHFAHASASLPFEARHLGDNAVTEAWAFLLEHLVSEPSWLARRLDVGGLDELAAEAATVLLHFVRRYCGKLLYELELHDGADLDAMPARYAERMLEATRIEHSETDSLLDVDPGFYVTSYLRAWALEAQLASHLREEFGTAWFASRKAGSLLRDLWHEGQGMDADRLADEVTGAELDLAVLAESVAGAARV